ncbi:uncharacterized protein [Medicago truncatula]|uniref:uncharacterized protein isoform X1 n=1 Tax=Medicago truncatula TaxID=3880 RepID=UPI0019673A7B|nr:uncharacterized protein LOC25482971 isoform X1 [Medicago truncatula]
MCGILNFMQMNEYKSTNPPGGAEKPTQPTEERKSKSSKPKEKSSKIRHLIPKSRHESIDNETNTTTKKNTRRQQRSSDPTADSSTHDSSAGSRHRRHRRGSDSVPPDAPQPGTKTHRRKPKNSEDGGSVRKPNSRKSSKGDSLTDISLSDFGSGSLAETENGPN